MVGLALEEAIALLLGETSVQEERDTVDLLHALDRVIAQEVVAAFDNPPFDRSPLDGYAFLAKSSLGATAESPQGLVIIGEVCPGHVFPQRVGLGQAVRIMTGAKIPLGCDCVIRQEDVVTSGDQVMVPRILKSYENYCFQGDDIKKGSRLIEKGTCLNHSHIGVLASMGYSRVVVYRLPRVGILSTGDEILPVGQPLSEGKIYNSNSYTLASRLQGLGVIPVILTQGADDALAVAAVIDQHLAQVDLLITTGGVSVGKMDIIHDVIRILAAKRLFWRVNMKPGTPVLCYQYQGKLCLGLSGNPYAALATFELLVRPVLAKMSQKPELMYDRLEATLTDDFLKASPSRRLVRAHYNWQTAQVSLPRENHSSGALFCAMNCNAMVDIPSGTDQLRAGDLVQVVVL